MKTKIWKKICDRVRIVEDGKGYFVVEAREKDPFKKDFEDWHQLNTFGNLKQALNKKHSFIIMILMRDLGLRHTFISRRIMRKKEKARL